MMEVRIMVTVAGKPEFVLTVGKADGDRTAAPAKPWSMAAGKARCPECRDGRNCRIVSSCEKLLVHLEGMAPYEKAALVLTRGGFLLGFEGSAQSVAAFTMLAAAASTMCGRFSRLALLLPFVGGIAGFGDRAEILSRIFPEPEAGATTQDEEDWRGPFKDFLKMKVEPLLKAFDGPEGDILRNACQILYSVGNLAGDPRFFR